MAHRNLFQDDKAESEDKEVLRTDGERGQNTNLDSVDCLSAFSETSQAMYL